MSQNDLFTFTYPIAEADIVKADITLNPLHPIFEAHFPGRPILPGVYMVQLELKISTEGEKIRVVAQLLSNAVVFFKFKGVFVKSD